MLSLQIGRFFDGLSHEKVSEARIHLNDASDFDVGQKKRLKLGIACDLAKRYNQKQSDDLGAKFPFGVFITPLRKERLYTYVTL